MFRPPLAGRVTAPAPFPEYDGDSVVQPDFSLGLFLPASATEAQLRAISSLFARVREFVNACRRRQDSLSLWDSALGSPRPGGRIRNFSHLQLCSWKYLQIIK